MFRRMSIAPKKNLLSFRALMLNNEDPTSFVIPARDGIVYQGEYCFPRIMGESIGVNFSGAAGVAVGGADAIAALAAEPVVSGTEEGGREAA